VPYIRSILVWVRGQIVKTFGEGIRGWIFTGICVAILTGLGWLGVKELTFSEVWKFLVLKPSALFWKHPTIGFLYLMLITGAFILVIPLFRARRRIRAQGERLREGDKFQNLITRTGLTAHWPHGRNDGTGASWVSLCRAIRRPPQFVWILGANGADTFSLPNSPLYEVLEDFPNSLRVMLAHPDSEFTSARATDVHTDQKEYRRLIIQSVERLKALYARRQNIEARYYWDRPTWKMIITGRSMWVQYYQPGQHVANTPVFRFAAGTRNNLYQSFYQKYEHLWYGARQHIIKLD
jgi:hypothetical protein